MNEPAKKKIYAIPLDALEELLGECETQFAYTQDLLSEKLLEKGDRSLISLLCEFYSSSEATSKHLIQALENYEEEDGDQVYIAADSMLIVESALVSRYLVSNELLKYNVSLAIN